MLTGVCLDPGNPLGMPLSFKDPSSPLISREILGRLFSSAHHLHQELPKLQTHEQNKWFLFEDIEL